MTDVAIQAIDLSKTFRPAVVAVNGLDLNVSRGAVYGLIGRNGAGKSTTLRLLMGLLRPDRGTAHILGRDLKDSAREIRQRVTYVSQEQQLPWGLSGEDLFEYFGTLYDSWDQAYAVDLGRRFDVDTSRPLGTLSGGDQRRVAVILSLAARPDVVILDEPAAGLDPVSRRQLIEAMIDFLGDGGERTVLFSTHILADLERVADHIGLMDRGRMMLSGSLDTLQGGMRRVQVIFDDDHVPAGFEIPGELRRRIEGPVLTAVVRLTRDDQLHHLRAHENLRVQEHPLGLEDLFIDLMEPGPRAPGEHDSFPWWRTS
jgi:ABC-2 type transport system ATP-binding protein